MVDIARVSAPNDNWGATESIGGFYLYGYYGNQGAYLNRQIRQYPSNNPPDASGWRKPSRYRRVIERFDDVLSSRTGSLAGGYYLPGDNMSGMRALCAVPSYWDATLDVTLSEDLRNEAITRALNRLSGQKADWGADLAESVKTASHLADSATTLLLAYRAARRGNWRKLQKILGITNLGSRLSIGSFAANRWLEWRYGWMPLMSSIRNTHEALTSQLETKDMLIHGNGGADRSGSFVRDSYASTSRLTYRINSSAQQLAVVKLTAVFQSEYWRSANKFGLLNPLTIAWEVVPFSFVLDWFVPVGNTLEALSAKAGLSFKGGSLVMVTGGESRVTVVASNRPLLVSGRATQHVFSVERFAYSGFPSPMLYAVQNPFKTNRILSALALWRTTANLPKGVRKLKVHRKKGIRRMRRRRPPIGYGY